MTGARDGGGNIGSQKSTLETAATNRMEKDVQSLMSLKPFARFLLQYVKDGGDINVDSDSSDKNNVPSEMRLILEQLKPLIETMSRDDLMLLLEKAASGLYEDDLLMHLATDGEKEEEGEVVEERADLDLEEIMGTLKPGYVVKTKDARGRKVLVNVCGAKEVPKPARWRITEEEEEEEGGDDHEINDLEKTHRFPLACSDKRVDIDRNGNACDVYDVAFNDEVVEVAAKAMFDIATREAKLRDTLATVCVEVVSKKCTTGGGEGNALDPKFTLPKRAFAGASLPPPMRVKKFLSSSLTRSQLRQQHARRRIVEINTTSNNNNATEGATPMSPLSTTRRQHHRMEQTSSEDEDEEEGGFAFRLSPERKKKRKQSQLKNVTTIANAAAADTAAATTSATKKLRVKIETSYPDKPLTTFATVKLTFDSEQSLDRAKLNVCSRESTLRVSFDDDHHSKEGEDDEKEDLRRGEKSTQHQTEFPFFIDVEKIREIEVEELPRGEKEGEMGDTSGSDTSGRDPLTVMLKIPFILIK